MTNVFPTADFSKMYEPVTKLIELNLAKFQSTVEAQTAMTRSYIEQADTRLKAATEIKDFDALATFMKEQNELARSNMEKMVEDSKSALEEVVSYGNELQTIFKDGVSSVTEAPKPARKTAAKK